MSAQPTAHEHVTEHAQSVLVVPFPDHLANVHIWVDRTDADTYNHVRALADDAWNTRKETP